MFSASLTFFLITWRRHLLSKNSQSSVRGDEVGKCTVRSACLLVPEAGSIQPKIPDRSKTRLAAIHSTKNQTGPIGKSGPPQKVDQFLRSFFGPKFPEIFFEWIVPLRCPHMKLKWSALITSGAPLIVFDISRGLYLSETDYRRFRPKGLSTYSLFSA